ncbi:MULTISPECIES: tautomerase family protein [Endozoicomonas]|uniref:tautomerase family protein n=1 Tax=Endozoicomonas TaxID=305899 RepID=UPI0008268E50|nr:tautomerase family protein [Endozoicomonas atrinae]
MPFVSVKTVKGLFNEIQKQEVMDGISELLVKVAAGGEDRFQQAVWVVIEEQEPGNWSLGDNSPELEASRQKRGTGKS